MRYYLLLALYILVCFEVSAILVRHDKADSLYVAHDSPLPALVTFTTMHKGQPYVVGSGTYLGDGWVLTAAHVAHFLEPDDKAEILTQRLAVRQKIIHEQWRDQHYGYDIALVKIDTPAREVAPVSLFSHAPQPGDIITLIGRGDTGNGLTGGQPSDLQTRVAVNQLDAVDGQWLKFTFNSAQDGALEREGISGAGDSGSPAYIQHNGTIHIIGLSSWQDTEPTQWQEGRYGVKEHYTHLNHYQQWIYNKLPQAKLRFPASP